MNDFENPIDGTFHIDGQDKYMDIPDYVAICQWTTEQSFTGIETGCGGFVQDKYQCGSEENFKYKYCPYCGQKIVLKVLWMMILLY